MNAATDPRPQVQQSWYREIGKRQIDLAIALLSMLCLMPVFLVVAALIKCTSRGPVFFRQVRVGLQGAPFQLFKFRSMRPAEGPDITAMGDKRVTAVGRVLRKSKLDELPQLWNVLRGDMSLVGPRPELPRYVAMYDDDQRAVLQVRPGITDPASIRFRDEEKVLGKRDNPQRFYVEALMPEKLAMNLHYISNISFKRDLQLILKTVGVVTGIKE